MEIAKPEQTAVNEPRTGAVSDAPLTHSGSPDVPTCDGVLA